MLALAAVFAVLAIVLVATACLTGSAAALAIGLVDVVVGLGVFCRWAGSL